MKYLLSLDIGTTSVKAGLFDTGGICLAAASEEYQLLTPKADQVELDPETYWTASCNTLRSVLDRADIDRNSVSVLTVSSQGETLISLDQNAKPVRNAIVWMDNRAVSEAEFLRRTLGSNVYDITGIPEIVPTWPACKILWLKQNEPENYARTVKFLLVQDYLVYRLSGRFVTDGSISCTTLLFDIIRHDWWAESLNAVGLERSKLPAVQRAGSIAGNLTSEAARILGLSSNVAIVCGGMDQSVGAIGAGNIEEGMLSETTGAALAVQVCVQDPLIDPNRMTPVYVHSVTGRYLFVPVCPTAGMTFKWFKDNFVIPDARDQENAGQIDYYQQMNEMASQVPAGCDGLVMLPHLMGAFSPDANPFARGAFAGFTLHHRKEHFVRAIQEAVAFMLRQNIEAVQKSGVKVHEIRSSGGASRSQIWNQIKADVCGLPIVKLENEDTGLVGDAILGGVAIGVFPSIQDACAAMVHTSTRVQPSAAVVEYEKYYRRYIDFEAVTKAWFIRNYSA